ncbi:MAG: hypothetical protein ACRBCJ_04640 [Hyphomicrobiaceae bacterium]
MTVHFPLRAAGLAAGLICGMQVASAVAQGPSVLNVLFESPHLASIEKGRELVYKFDRKVSDTKTAGEEFQDDIKLGIIEVDEKTGKRKVTIKIFTGDRARKQQRITGMTGNPVLVVFLDRAVSNFARLAGGNRPYLKDRFRIGLRDSAKIEATKLDYKGSKVDGFRVTVSPYAQDPNRLKMRGYEGAKFVFNVSDQVPGHFLSLKADYTSTVPESATLSETIVLHSEGKAEEIK